jgi:hypothetical protein
MRFSAKAAIMAALAGPAVAALILTGAGAANAATTSNTSGPFSPFCGQFQNHFPNQFQNQFPFQQGQWDLSGPNTLRVGFEVNTYAYAVDFNQRGTCLGGSLTDQFVPITGSVHGNVFGDSVTFWFNYGSGSRQGTRTFTGHINQFGHVTGTWSETGPENASGTWTLTRPAFRNCQMNFNHNHNFNQNCFFGHP